MDDLNGKATTAPYVSFVSFKTLLDWLQTDHVPAQLDRSFWGTKFSGSVGTQLMLALRYFELLDGETPTPKLEQLASAKEEERKPILADLLQKAYPSLFSLELDRATPKMIEDKFTEIGGEGQTKRKAVSFFINACKYAEVPLSNAVKKKARNKPSNSGVKPSRNKRVEDDGQDGADTTLRENGNSQLPPSTEGSTNSTILTLGPNESLMLIVNGNLLNLGKEDRDFVMQLVDQIQKFEAERDKEAEG